MVSVFAREITDDLASMVKQLDTVVGKNKSKQMRGFVILLTDDPDEAEEKLTALKKKHKIKNIPLTVFDGIAGPPRYKIAKDADFTVSMWVKQRIKLNHAFKKKDLNKKSIKSVVASTKKILD